MLLLTSLFGAAGASPASDLFQAGAATLQREYGGWSKADLGVLSEQYSGRLAQRCQDHPACPSDTGRAVLAELLRDLHDPHTSLRDPDAARRVRAGMGGPQINSAGLRLTPVRAGLLVTAVTAGSPAERAGLQRWDVLIGVNGAAPTLAGFARAEQRTELRLKVQRAGQPPFELQLSPQVLPAGDLPSLAWQDGAAVIMVPTFLQAGVADRFAELLRQVGRRGARLLVVDLRFNSGGRLDQCVPAASLFAPLAYHAQGQGRRYDLSAQDGRLVSGASPGPAAPLWASPLAVLVGPATASCAELFAWSVQRSAHAQVIGEATRGVLNSAVDFFDLPGGVLLTVTTYRAYDGAGQALPERVQPDVVLKQDWPALLERGQDNLLGAALNQLKASSP